MNHATEIQRKATFNAVRYANCWEDADILLEALQPEGKICASIGSAGDNSLSILAQGAAKVHIVEMNPAQLACIHLRISAYGNLIYDEFLKLHGERVCTKDERIDLYNKCKKTCQKIH